MVQAPPQYSNGQSLIRPGQYTDPPRLIDPKTNEPFAEDGAMALPHVFNFAAIWNYFNQTYSYRYDEALKQSYENSLAMRRDTFIWACLEERYLGVISKSWNIKPIGRKKDDDSLKDRADELTQLVLQTPCLLNYFWCMEDAAWYGRYAVQHAFGSTDINGMQQRCINRWVPVNGDKVQCEWDGVPAIMVSPQKTDEYRKNGWTVKPGERSQLVYLDKPELRDRFAVNQHWRDDADYFEGEMAGAVAGVGIRSRIYWYWWIKTEMLGWTLNYFRKVGTLGLLIFPFDEGNPDSEAAAKTNSRQAGNRSTLIMPVPRGADPKHLAPQIIAPTTAGIDALTAVIDSYYERHIERYIVGQNMSDGSDNDSGLGGSGRANFAAGSQYLKIKCDADMLAESFTRDTLRIIHRMNYPGEPFRFRFEFNVDDPKSKERMEAAKAIVEMGANLRADDVREIGGFGKPNPEDEVVGGQIAPAPFGKGLDGEPMKTPMGFGNGEPGGQAGDEQQQEAEKQAADEQYQRDAMNDRQFAEAMAELKSLRQSMGQQQYTRSNDEAVMMLNQRINDLAMQRYDKPSGGGMELHLPAESSFTMKDVKIAGIEELVAALREQKAPNVTLTAPAPQVTVEAAQAPNVNVTVEGPKAPTINVAAPQVNVEAPAVTVNVPEPPEMEVTEIERGKDGLIARLIRKLKRR